MPLVSLTVFVPLVGAVLLHAPVGERLALEIDIADREDAGARHTTDRRRRDDVRLLLHRLGHVTDGLERGVDEAQQRYDARQPR